MTWPVGWSNSATPRSFVPGCPPPPGSRARIRLAPVSRGGHGRSHRPDFPSSFTATERPRAVSNIVFTQSGHHVTARESEVTHGRALLRFRDRGCHRGLFPGSRSVTRRFDPFAPVWLFLVGYVQVYVIQALSYHDWAMDVRGKELVDGGEFPGVLGRAVVPGCLSPGIGRRIAPALPRPPRGWSSGSGDADQPVLVLWGLYCAGVMIKGGLQGLESVSPEEALFRSFPFVMMVAAILLIVTGRSGHAVTAAFSAGRASDRGLLIS